PPFLSGFKNKYSGSKGLIPVYPSKTFPNHYSIVTGMYAGNHGIVSNEFYDPQKGKRYSVRDRSTIKDGSWYGGVPLWVLAEKQGMLTAPYFWVGSETNILGTLPTYYYSFDSKVPYLDRARQVIKWLKLPLEKRPHFITLYFSIVDTMGHRYGPGSKQLKDAVFKVDGVLDWLFKEIEKLELPVNIIIVSDHGMMEMDTAKIEYLDDYVDLEKFHIELFESHCFLYAGNLSRGEV
ncbi:MAG: alkaline phosphatase family protein, partial [bacterium]|nr:alkaline phosphatase family protein [bacterium]